MTDIENRSEIRRMRRLLREIAELAQHSSMTGSLSGGGPSAIRRYNAIVAHLEQKGITPPGFFQPVPEGASFDELGVESSLLAGYLKEVEAEADESMPPPPPGGPHGNVVIGLGGLKELQELKEFGKMFRENFWTEWKRGHSSGSEQQESSSSGEAEPTTLADVESRLSEVGSRLQATAEQLRGHDLTDEQRAELADQLSRLGQEQARLARQRARMR